MAIVFAYRSDQNSFDARYATGKKAGTVVNTVTNAVDATAIGGRAVVFQTPGSWQLLSWDAALNTPNTRIMSILVRYLPNYTGSPAARRAIIGISSGSGATGPALFQLYHETTGQLVLHATNESATASINFVNMGAFSPTSGTWYDIVIAWDGTTSANAAKVYLDASLLGQTTAGSAKTASWTNLYYESITVGLTPTATAASGKLNELVIFDTVIDGTASQNLESGTGTLNGASRTAFISDVAGATLTSFEGANSTDPGIANVKTGTSYIINGSSLTGTYAVSGGGHCASQFNWSN